MKRVKTVGEIEQRQHRWALAFWVSVVLLAVYIAVFTKAPTYAEQTARCNDQHIQSFEGCMGWIEGRF
jgi:hypothetical protein